MNRKRFIEGLDLVLSIWYWDRNQTMGLRPQASGNRPQEVGNTPLAVFAPVAGPR